MTLTISVLTALGISPAWHQPLQAACSRFGITTPARLAAFLAQVAHESACCRRLEEGLSYSTPERICLVYGPRVGTVADVLGARLVRNPRDLACRVYAGRNGNGDVTSGDGWTYRGRGLLQITGRANYRACGIGCGQPYETTPDLLLQPEHAALASAWWWADHGCNALADTGQFDRITRVVNGPAMAGAQERRELHRQALQALGAVQAPVLQA